MMNGGLYDVDGMGSIVVRNVRILTQARETGTRKSNLVCTRNEMSTDPEDAGEPPALGCLNRVEPVDRVEVK